MSHSNTRRTSRLTLDPIALILFAAGLAIVSNVFADPKESHPGGIDAARSAVSMTTPEYYALLHSVTTGPLSRVVSRATNLFSEGESSCHTRATP